MRFKNDIVFWCVALNLGTASRNPIPALRRPIGGELGYFAKSRRAIVPA